jgi:TP901 family phage tail tape measure protein
MLGAFNVVLGVDIKKLQQGLNQASGMLKDFSAGVKQTGQTLTRTLTVPIVGVGSAMLKTAADFERAMNQVGAVTGATGEEFNMLREQAKELGRTTKFTATQAAEGMNFLAMAGFETSQIMTAMPGVLNLASAGAMDLATASDIASNILTGFNMDAEDMASVVDVMAKTFTSSNTNLMQLGHAMSFVAPVAAGFGVSIEETSAIIGMLSDAGIQASRAGTTLRGIMVQLGEASKELGFSMNDSNGQMRPMAELLDELIIKSGGTQNAIDMFGQRAGPGLVALLQQGTTKLRDFEEALKDSGGTAEIIAERQMQGLAGALTEARSALEGMLISFADIGILSAAEELVDKVTAKIRQFTNASDETKQNIVKLLAVLAGVGPALLIIAAALKVVAFGMALVSSPIFLIIAGITALVGAFLYMLDNWEAVKERMADTAWWRNTLIELMQLVLKYNVFSLFIDGVVIAIRFMAEKFGGFFNWLVGSMLTVKADILEQFSEIATKAANMLSKIPFFEGAADGVKEIAENLALASTEAKEAAESGTDFAANTEKALGDLDKVNPFRAVAAGLDEAKTQQKEYNNEFKKFGDYVNISKEGIMEMLGLTELLSMATEDATPTEGEADITPKVDEGEITKTLTLFGRLRQDFARIRSDAALVKRAYTSLGEGIADAFTKAIMTGKSLADQLKQLAGLLASKALQFALTTLLTGGLSIGGSETTGFLGQGGGLLGSLFKRLAGSAAPVPVGTEMIGMASSNLNGVSSDTGFVVASAFETALENYTSKLGPDEFFTLSQKGQYGF